MVLKLLLLQICHFSFVFVLLFAGVLGYAGNRVVNLEKDLEVLKVELPKKHINLFAKISRDEFDKRIDVIKLRLGSLDEESFFMELFHLMTDIGDEHTRIIPKDFYDYVLPVGFEMFKEGAFVIQTDNPDLLLAKLRSINGVPVDEVWERFKKIILSENDSFFKTTALFYINNGFILKGLNIAGSKEEVFFTFEKNNGDVAEVLLKHSPKAVMVQAEQLSKLKSNQLKSNYGFLYDSDKKVVYFNYRRCNDDENYPFVRFNSELFEFIGSNKAQKLIVDLRFNQGGNSRVLAPFLDSLKGCYLNKAGNLYVLIGKMTFSSALLNALVLKRNFNSILVGEPTAGGINHYGEIRSFELPQSDAKVIYSTKYFNRWKGHDGALVPDIKIDYSIDNFKDGLDEALEYIY